MKNRGNRGSYLVKYTDDVLLTALDEALETPTVTAAEIASIVGCNPRYAVIRLNEMVESGKIEAVMKGNTWGFKHKKENVLGNNNLRGSVGNGICA